MHVMHATTKAAAPVAWQIVHCKLRIWPDDHRAYLSWTHLILGRHIVL